MSGIKKRFYYKLIEVYEKSILRYAIDFFVYFIDLLTKKRSKIISNLEYLILGTPRSGTGFLSKLFTSAGIECGHEKVFSVYKYEHLFFNFFQKRYQADSSFIAVPYIKQLIKEKKFNNNLKFVHIIRNPIDVISSLMNLEFFSKLDDKRHLLYLNFINKYLPELKKYSNELDQCVYFWINWNKMIEKNTRSVKYYRYRIEDITSEPLSFFRGIGAQIKSGVTIFNNDRYNNKMDEKKKSIIIKLIDIKDEKLKIEFINLAKDYGYDLSGF